MRNHLASVLVDHRRREGLAAQLRRGDDPRWPCFHERDQALRRMTERRRRVQVFA